MNFASTYHGTESSRASAGIRSAGRLSRGLLAGAAALVLFTSLAARAQVSMFLRIGGQATAIGGSQTTPLVPGGSVDAQYPRWINVLSMSHGISLQVSTSSGGGTTVGRSQHSDLSLMKVMDDSTPSLDILVNGSASGLPVSLPIDYVTLDFRRDGASPVVFYRVELQDVYVTSYQVSASSETPTESLSLNYARIRWTYVPVTNTGKVGSPITKGWDVIKNAPF